MQLSENELRSLIKVKRKTDRTLYGLCPKCGKNEFGISIKGPHLFGCFRKKKCGFTGNIFTLLRFLGLSTPNDKKSFLGFDISFKLEKFEQENSEILKKVQMPIGFKRVNFHEYLNSRGYQAKDYENYVCGASNLEPKLKNRVVIGFRDEIGPIGYIARALTKEEPKYLNKGENFSKMLDGLNESPFQEATIVEGHFSRINTRNCFEELGIQSRVVSTFGAKISDYQVNLLIKEGITRVNLFFEQDVYKMLMKSSEKLIHKFDSFTIMKTSSPDSDPGNMNIIEIGEAYLNRQNFFKFATTKLPSIEL
jgi:ssDNA-binding Zn-finger/Zn-ribbon topoisomerase 1